MFKTRWIARNLALALLGGAWTPRSGKARAEKVLGPASRKLRCKLVDEVFARFPEPHRTSPGMLQRFILEWPEFEKLNAVQVRIGRKVPPVVSSQRFVPAPQLAHLRIPPLATQGELAAWLRLSPGELDWFADERRQNAEAEPGNLHHYAYRFVPKASGATRLIEEPKPRLKAMQRRILHEILNPVPVHPCAHGFVRRRSIQTAAQIHGGEQMVICLDLKNFFLMTDMHVVHWVFRRLGYPWSVARALTGLCAGIVPLAVFDRLPEAQRPPLHVRRRFAMPHLPQGSPTSPALANLAAHRLDARLAGLATSFCANYSRYADDLTFSGDAGFGRGRHAFLAAVSDIVEDEGFAINTRKTRVMPHAGRQQVLGLVVNDGINIARPAFDELKAVLHNCRIKGWRAQNRAGAGDFRAHLDGRISWVESVHPSRGLKLRAAFHQIDWA